MKHDSTKWRKENIIKVKSLLHRFIPLIIFYDIESTDFFYKVYCYKDILPHWEFHIVPNMKLKTNIAPPRMKFELDSTLIESKHIPLFASWIDRKYSSHYNKKNLP